MADAPAAPASAVNALYPTNAEAGKPGEIAPAAAPVDPAAAAPAAPSVEPAAAAPEGAPAEGEAKPVEETKPEGEAPAKIDPASYEIKLAEGFVVDEPSLNEFKTTAAELGLPPEGAQKLVDLYTKVAQAQVAKLNDASAAEFQRQQSEWTQQVQAMPEFQGERAAQTTAFLGRVMDEFGSPEAREYLNSTGAGNHPAIVKMILGMANALLEGEPTPVGKPGSLASPTGKAPARRSGAEILYPSAPN
jgi:hypothetical protein